MLLLLYYYCDVIIVIIIIVMLLLLLLLYCILFQIMQFSLLAVTILTEGTLMSGLGPSHTTNFTEMH